MDCKIRVKVRDIEIEYEGTETYLKENLPDLIQLLAELPTVEEPPVQLEEEEVLPASEDPGKKKFELTTNMIAARLGANSGPDLILAACAHLDFVKGQQQFHRKNILAEMKDAKSYFKTSYASGNLSTNLKNLVRGKKLMEQAQDVYALDAATRSELESKLRS
ncbi:MAG: hypothetical protein JO170_13940 [Verrucomicrobia bacterium]|nr:hypothetical protein [Verrucomicrobiota bacterium]